MDIAADGLNGGQLVVWLESAVQNHLDSPIPTHVAATEDLAGRKDLNCRVGDQAQNQNRVDTDIKRGKLPLTQILRRGRRQDGYVSGRAVKVAGSSLQGADFVALLDGRKGKGLGGGSCDGTSVVLTIDEPVHARTDDL